MQKLSREIKLLTRREKKHFYCDSRDYSKDFFRPGKPKKYSALNRLSGTQSSN